MRIRELFEQTVAPQPMALGATVPPPVGAPVPPGGAAQPNNAMQAAQAVQAKQQKTQQEKALQDQITALQKQLSDLRAAPSV